MISKNSVTAGIIIITIVGTVDIVGNIDTTVIIIITISGIIIITIAGIIIITIVGAVETVGNIDTTDIIVITIDGIIIITIVGSPSMRKPVVIRIAPTTSTNLGEFFVSCKRMYCIAIRECEGLSGTLESQRNPQRGRLSPYVPPTTMNSAPTLVEK